MDTSNKEGNAVLQKAFSNWNPVVLVLSTQQVDDCCKLNTGLSFCGMMQCFSVLKENLSYRLANATKTISKEHFAVDWISAEDLVRSALPDRIPFPSTISKCPKVEQSPLVPEKDLNTVISMLCGKTSKTPWYEQYCLEYFKLVGTSQHELFAHPILTLYVTSSRDPSPFRSFQQLFNDFKKIAPYFVDLNTPRVYAVLEDHSQPLNENDRKSFLQTWSEFKRAVLPAKCYTVHANSLPEPGPVQFETSTNDSFPFAKAAFRHPNKCSSSDFDSLGKLAQMTIVENLVPHMQNTIQAVNQEVLNHRTGIKHKWNMWFGKTPQKKQENEISLRYEFTSLEFLQRRLADWAFMLGDYWLASRTYKSLSEVYRSEGAFLWEAGALEFQAISSVMSSPVGPYIGNGREEASTLEAAIIGYAKEGGTFYSRRASIARGFLLSCWSKDNLGAAKLFAELADHETVPLLRALLHEQAALNFLIAPKAFHRKYGFHMVLSAQNFGRLSLLDHAQRSLLNAYNIYMRQPWSAVHDHIHFNVARLSFILGDINLSALMMNRLLAANGQSAQQQSEYLREFLYIFGVALPQAGTTNTDCFDVPLPLLDSKKIQLHVRDNHDPAATRIEGQMWAKLVDSAYFITVPFNKRSVMSLLRSKAKAGPKIAIINETIYVETELKNPLRIPIQFTDMQLICTHSKATTEAFVVEPCNTLLPPSATKQLFFALRPLEEGTLFIKGLQFKLFDKVKGQRLFEFGPPPSTPTKSAGSSKSKQVEPPTKGIQVTVIGAMPLLEPQWEGWPTSLMLGESHPVKLRLTNNGQTPIASISMSLSDPKFFCFPTGLVDHLSLFLPDDEKKYSMQLQSKSTNIVLSSPLAPKESITQTMWIRPHLLDGSPQPQSTLTKECSFAFQYTPLEPNPTIKSRVQKAVAKVCFEPSLEISTFTTGASHPNEMTFVLDISNKSHLVFHITKIRTFSKSWKASGINQHDQQSPYWVLEPVSSIRVFLTMSELQLKSSGVFVSRVDQQSSDVVPVEQDYAELAASIPSESNLPLDLEGNPLLPLFSFLQKDRLINTPPPDPNDDPNDPLLLLPVKKLDHIVHLVLSWETVDSHGIKRCGQHNQVNLEMFPMDTQKLFSATPLARRKSLVLPTIKWQPQDQQSPLVFSLFSEQQISHDFEEGLCTVPITVHVSNISPFDRVTYNFEALVPTVGGHGDGSFRKLNQYFWGGITSRSSQLEAKETNVFTLHAGFSGPGIYSIDSLAFDVTVFPHSGGLQAKYRMTPRTQHLIQIK